MISKVLETNFKVLKAILEVLKSISNVLKSISKVLKLEITKIQSVPFVSQVIHGNYFQYRFETVCKFSATLTVRNRISHSFSKNFRGRKILRSKSRRNPCRLVVHTLLMTLRGRQQLWRASACCGAWDCVRFPTEIFENNYFSPPHNFPFEIA